MSTKYAALKTIGVIYKVLAIISAVITVLLIIGVCGTAVLGGMAFGGLSRDFGGFLGSGVAGVIFGLIYSIVILIYGGGLSVTLYALGEMIDLVMALEENTRLTAQLLSQQMGGR